MKRDEMPLSADAIEIATALMASVPEPRSIVDEDLLARFVLGWVSEIEHAAVVSAITASPSLRTRCLSMFDQVRAMQAGIEARDSILRREPSLAEALKAILERSLKYCYQWRSICEQAIGGHLNQEVPVRQMLLNFGNSLSLSPVRPALTRSGRRKSDVSIQPNGRRATLEVDEIEGGLHVKAELLEALDQDNEISLYAVEPGGGWVWIGSALVSGLSWSLNAPHVLDMLGLTFEEFDPGWLVLVEGRMLPRGDSITLTIAENLRQAELGHSVRLKLIQPPTVKDGQLSMRFAVPPALRERYKDAVLSLSLDLGPVRYPVAALPISELGHEPAVEMSAAMPGVIEDGEFEYLPGLSLELRVG